MKSSSGKAVKIIAVVLGVLGMIAAFGVGSMKEDGFSFALFVCAAAAALILAVLLYGFGELIENSAQTRQMTYELNSNLRELAAKLESKSAQAAAPAKKAEASAQSAGEKKEDNKPAVNPLAPYEKLASALKIYEYFCAAHRDDANDDIAACADRLKKLAEKEESTGNSKNNALSLLKSFYKHDCRIYAVDRSGSTFRCPVCGNKIFSDRRSCHHCGVLFRV